MSFLTNLKNFFTKFMISIPGIMFIVGLIILNLVIVLSSVSSLGPTVGFVAGGVRAAVTTVLLIIGAYIVYTYIITPLTSESFEVLAEPTDKVDLLDKTITEIKQEYATEKSDATLVYRDAPQKLQGWWEDTINCEQSGKNDIYCKPKEEWIFPY